MHADYLGQGQTSAQRQLDTRVHEADPARLPEADPAHLGSAWTRLSSHWSPEFRTSAAARHRRDPTPTYRQPGLLRELATTAGLTPGDEFGSNWAFEYPDLETLGRAMVAVAGLAVIAGPEREQELKQAIVDGLAPYRQTDGSYQLSNEYHYLIARA